MGPNRVQATVNKTTDDQPIDEMRPEYDFSQGVRGKYVRRYREGSNLVLLDPDPHHPKPPRPETDNTP